MKTKEEELKEEIKKIRAERKKQLIKGFPECSNEKIEEYLNYERNDSEYCWGKYQTDLLEAELKGITEATKDFIEMIDEKMIYPIDIFPKLTEKDLSDVNKLLILELGFPLDRLSAHIGRLLLIGLQEKLKKLKNEN